MPASQPESPAPPDVDFYGDDYVYFGPALFSDDKNRQDAEALATMLALGGDACILDLGCGYGRIANEMARRGYRVTGLDRSGTLLRQARLDAERVAAPPRYVQGDMRHLPWEGCFDAVYLWYTTFGCFDEAGDREVIRAAWKVLRPGGLLLIEQLNKPFLYRRGLPDHLLVEKDGNYRLDIIDFDGKTERWSTRRITTRDGASRVTGTSFRLYGIPEFRSLFEQAGFSAFNVFGTNGGPYSLFSERISVVGQKPC